MSRVIVSELLGLPASGAGLLPAPKSVVPFASNLIIGDTDLYTVPVGRKALVFSSVVQDPLGSPAGGIFFFIQAKIGGTYFPLGGLNRVNPGFINAIQAVGRIFNAGETVSIHITTNAGASAWVNILEFASYARVFSPTLTTLNAGDNVLYQAPTVNGSYLLSSSTGSAIFLQSTIVANLPYVNNSGASRTLSIASVPNGSTPGIANLITPTPVVVTNALRSDFSPVSILNQGDFINVNVDSGAAIQIVWCNVVEM